MTPNPPDKCINGARYKFVPGPATTSSSSGSPYTNPTTGELYAPEYYLAQIVAMLKPIYEHLTAWQGVIISNEIVAPAKIQRKRYRMTPAARTIRIEADTPIQVWLNDDRGMAIPVGGERRALYLSDLPPNAAIHDIYVTTSEETHLYILAVA